MDGRLKRAVPCDINVRSLSLRTC